MDQLSQEESLDIEHVEKNRILCVVCASGETTCSGQSTRATYAHCLTMSQQWCAYRVGEYVLVDNEDPLDPGLFFNPDVIFRNGVNVSNVFTVLSVSIMVDESEYEPQPTRVSLEVSNRWILGADSRTMPVLATDVHPLPPWMDWNQQDSPTIYTTHFDAEGEFLNLHAGWYDNGGTFWVEAERGGEDAMVEYSVLMVESEHC